VVIRITPRQVERLAAESDLRALDPFVAPLAEDFPSSLGRFPHAQRAAIVANMRGRARARGVQGDEAQWAWCRWMLAFSPNFDAHPQVRLALAQTWLGVDRVVETLESRVTEQTLTEVEASAQDLPLFVPPEFIDAPLLQRTAAALPLALWREVQPAAAASVAQAAAALAGELGLGGEDDGPLTVAAWRLLYGQRFQDRQALPWLQDVFGEPRPPRAVIGMLKLRISLDHDRFV
jgi:hypothetical protein